MRRFLHHYGDVVTGVLSGFDRMRFRGTLRLLANARGLESFMVHHGVRLTEFQPFAARLQRQVRTLATAVAQDTGRPFQYLASPAIDKEAVARELAARDGISEGLIAVLACVESCRSFVLRSDKARGRLVLEAAPRKCEHYYFYELHPRFGFLHVRLQSWLPLNVWVCLNGREFLTRQLTAAGIAFTRQGNCLTQVAELAAAQRFLQAQVQLNWGRELPQVAAMATALAATLQPGYPLQYYWSLEESEWATDVLFREPADLARCYPEWIRHGVEVLGCTDVLRYLGKRVNQDGSVPARFSGEVVTDLRPTEVAAARRAAALARPSRRGAEPVRLKHRVNRNWVKMYDKAPAVLRVETVIHDPRDLRVYRRQEGEPADAPKHWRRLRKGVVDVPRRAAVSQQANARYLDALAAVADRESLGTRAAPVCAPVEWRGRRVRALNPLAPRDAAVLAAVSRGEGVLTGWRNRDVRACLFAPPADGAERRRQSAEVTRWIRLLRAHALVKPVRRTHRYHLTVDGRVTVSALLAARAADTRRLSAAA
jgi:hypothetical protein